MAVDLPGHGGSSAVRADLVGSARLVAAATGPGTFLGYSLGGRVALHLALDRPDLVERLVLIGATAGIEDERERAQRLAADERLAEHLETVGVAQFLDEWLADPLFESLSAERACLEERLANSASGLASSLRSCGTGTQSPLWDQLDRLTMPVLVIAGTGDEKFTVLGRRMVDAIGDNASFRAIDHAGHSAHLEQPSTTAIEISNWLSTTN